jgi:hypothetical protein
MAPFPHLDYCLSSVILPMKNNIQTAVNCSTRLICHAKMYFGAVESQKTHFDQLFCAIINSMELCFTSAHTIIITPTVWEPRKLQGIIDYAMSTRCTQKDCLHQPCELAI